MILAFIAFGVLFGASAAAFTLVSGGSILLAIVAYSIAGALGAVLGVGAILWLHGSKSSNDEWNGEKPSSRPATA